MELKQDDMDIIIDELTRNFNEFIENIQKKVINLGYNDDEKSNILLTQMLVIELMLEKYINNVKIFLKKNSKTKNKVNIDILIEDYIMDLKEKVKNLYGISIEIEPKKEKKEK